MKYNIWVEPTIRIRWWNPVSWLHCLLFGRKWNVMYATDNKRTFWLGTYNSKEEACYTLGLSMYDVRE